MLTGCHFSRLGVRRFGRRFGDRLDDCVVDRLDDCVVDRLDRWWVAAIVLAVAIVVGMGQAEGQEGSQDGAKGDDKKRVLIIVGPSNHPPGTHEVAAGGRLMEYSLEHAEGLVPAIDATVVIGWPEDASVRDGADTVVFIGDEFPPHKLPQGDRVMKELGGMVSRGCGVVCIHFATGLREPDVAPDGKHPLLDWIGGYFASRCSHHKSIARIFPEATITPAVVDGEAATHPVLRGWKAFTLDDEPYIDNYFGPPGHAERVGLIEFATSMLPPESPRRQVVAWGLERPDGGRGFGIVMPHYYRNWELADLRTLILNGIVWTAGVEIPGAGVRVELPALTSFDPQPAKGR